MRTLRFELATVRMGRGNARPAGKRGERVEFVAFARDGCLEIFRGTIAELSTKRRVLLRLDRSPDRALVPLDCLAAVKEVAI